MIEGQSAKKFLFDFDGVLTDQTREAGRVREIFRERLISLSEISPKVADQLFDRAEKMMNREPWLHGWKVRGRVSAFADEDLFIRNNGLASILDAWAEEDALLSSIRSKIAAAEVSDFFGLAQLAYRTMVSETNEGMHEPIDKSAAPLLQGLLDQGHSIVVVSNSDTDRIIRLLAGCGLHPESHADNSTARLRVRGGACKFDLGETPSTFEIGPYHIEIARPTYEQILRAENPIAVIGDVFSLDLALPLYLARIGVLPGLRIVLRTRHYTPAWSRNFFRHHDEKFASLHLLNELEDLKGILSGSA